MAALSIRVSAVDWMRSIGIMVQPALALGSGRIGKRMACVWHLYSQPYAKSVWQLYVQQVDRLNG